MTPAQRLEALKRLTAAKLAARCPVKPVMPPARFDWDRRWPTQYPSWAKGLTVAQFCAYDDRAGTFKTMGTADDYKSTAAYVKVWDRERNLKPAMEFVTPTLGNYA